MLSCLEKANRAAYAGAAMLSAGYVVFLTGALFQRAGDGGGLWVVALLLGPFVCTLFHELGHALFAMLSGWRVALVHVAPFAWRPSDNRLALVGFLGGQDVAGYCAIMPGNANATRAGYIFGVLGGPAASVALAALSALVAVAFVGSYSVAGSETVLPTSTEAILEMRRRLDLEEQSWLGLGLVTPFFGSLAAQSACAALFSLWPARIFGSLNDGGIILETLRTKSNARDAPIWVMVAMREGVSPRDWPPWIAAAVRNAMHADKPGGAAACALYLAMDVQPMDAVVARRAIEFIRASEETANDAVRNWLLAWDAIVAALLEHDPDRAQSLLDRIEPEHAEALDLLAVKAAVLALGDDQHARQKSLAAFEAERARHPLSSSAWKRLGRAIKNYRGAHSLGTRPARADEA